MEVHRSTRASLLWVLAFLAAPAVAQTTDWREVFSDTEKTIFIDASVMIRQGETRIATVKSNFAQPQGTGEKTYKSTLTLEFFVCETRLWGLKELEAYSELDLGGAVVLHYKGDAKRLISGRVTPGTAADAELRFVCAPLVEPSG